MNRHDWRYMPDACLERILIALPPKTISSLRLVSKSWRDQVSYTLTTLLLRSECDLKALLRSFPSIGTLLVTLGNGATLQPLSTLGNLTSLAIKGPDVRLLGPPIPFSDAALAQVAAMPRLTQLTLVKVTINLVSAQPGLQQLVTLKTLRLRGVRLCNVEKKHSSDSFSTVLQAFQGLEALELDELTLVEDNSGFNSTSTPSSSTAAAVSRPANETQNSQQWPTALSKMKNLKEIRLGGSAIPITDELCCAVASLPKLSSLELSRPGWWGYKSGTPENAQINNINANNNSVLSTNLRLPTLTEDRGLAALAARASTLRHLALCGCFVLASNAAVHNISALTSLTSLDFRTYSGEDEISRHQSNNNTQHHHVVELRGACLAQLTALKHLERLHLGGWPVSVDTSRALGRLRSLQWLEFSSCWDLGDSVVFELAKMSKLEYLALRRCVAVSDIGLAALGKGPLAQSLTALDLKGCHKNVTDQGLTAIQGLRKLRFLDLSGCELVSDLGIARGVSKMKFLEHLALSDTQISDLSCSLLATATPLLRVVHLEHCSKVTDVGADALARLNRLNEVKAFGCSMSGPGSKILSEKTGAVVSLYKPCWWSKSNHGNTSSSSIRRGTGASSRGEASAKTASET